LKKGRKEKASVEEKELVTVLVPPTDVVVGVKEEIPVVPQVDLKSAPIVVFDPEVKLPHAPLKASEVPAFMPFSNLPLALPVATPDQPASLLAPALEAKLQTLSAMGFTDRQHTCMLLSRFDGDLQRVVEALLFV